MQGEYVKEIVKNLLNIENNYFRLKKIYTKAQEC